MPRAGSPFSPWIGMRLGFQEDMLSGSAARASGHTSCTHLNGQFARLQSLLSLQQRGSSAPVPKLDDLMPVKDGV